MPDRRRVLLGLALADFAVLVAYITMLSVFVPLHEPWVDEAQAWLLSRDLSLYSLLFHQLRHEGHPALWYLLLWVPAHLHMSYALFNWLSAAIATAGTYVLLRWAPFPLYLRALLPFTFFLGYQYSIVARSYVLFPLLGFLVAHVYRLKTPRPVFMAVSLGLLANVSLHGTLVALAFAVLYAWKMRREDALAGLAGRRDLRLAAAVFAASILFVAMCVWPTVGALPRMSPTLNKIVDSLSLPVSEADRPRPAAAQPVILPSTPAAGALPTTATPLPGSSRMPVVPVVLRYAFASWGPLAFGFETLLLIYLFRRRELKLVLPAVLLALFLIFIYSAPWHDGLLWIACLMALWAAWDDRVPPRAWNLQNGVALWLALLCALQLPWTFRAFQFDAREATAPGKATAAYLQTLPEGARIAGLGLSGDIQPYFDHNIFVNQTHAFASLGRDEAQLTIEQAIASHPDVVLADSYATAAIEALGYRATQKFCGAIYLPNIDVAPDCLYVFESPRRAGSPRQDPSTQAP